MIAPVPLVGIVTALPAEARTLTSRRLPLAYSVQFAEGVLISRAGMGPERACRAADMLLERGAGALVSWGTAGGLDPGLRAGDLLLPERILGTDGIACLADRDWRAALQARLAPRLKALCGALVSQPSAVTGVAEKARLFKMTGARSVDMESGAVGAAAASAGVPFLSVRVIADPAGDTVNQLAIRALDATGRLRLTALAGGLCRRPGEIVALARLAGHFRAARRTLAVVARLAGVRLGCP